MSVFPNLFSPGRIRGLTVANRVIMPAMATNLASACGQPTVAMVAYYLERARGGGGLIVVENTCVDYPLGRNGAVQLRLDQDRFIPGLASLVEALHSTGCKVAIQLRREQNPL